MIHAGTDGLGGGQAVWGTGGLGDRRSGRQVDYGQVVQVQAVRGQADQGQLDQRTQAVWG